MNEMAITKGMKVQLTIPAARPLKTLSGHLFEAGQTFKVLGVHASLIRLSRVGDCAKVMVLPDMIMEIK
jgi:hypothetical protein